jgi:hypothetical protein
MKNSALLAILLALAACSSTPPPANWKMNAASQLEHAQQSWLEGDSKSAEWAMAQARKDISQSGRINVLATAELAACAPHIASLDFSPCSAFDKLAADASAQDIAYARFLAGDWAGLDIKLLPQHYASLVSAKDDVSANRAAIEIKAPLPRLIAAGVLFRSTRADAATLSVAVETAAERGWRRPLLAWLEVQKARAQASADSAAVSQLQRRIDLVLGH